MPDNLVRLTACVSGCLSVCGSMTLPGLSDMYGTLGMSVLSLYVLHDWYDWPGLAWPGLVWAGLIWLSVCVCVCGVSVCMPACLPACRPAYLPAERSTS